MTIEALALETGISYSYVGEVERGKRNPTLEVIEALASGLKVDAALLLEPQVSP